jgi:ribonuclease HI
MCATAASLRPESNREKLRRMPFFICETCSSDFNVSDAALAKYPNWAPKQCMKCRDVGNGNGRSRRPALRGDGGSVRAQPSGTRELNLPTKQVLARFQGGPTSGVFTDGSCQGNPGPGGWGAVHVENNDIVAERHGSSAQTTNNRMELTAVIAGLEMIEPSEEADLYTDSKLVVDTLTKWAASWEKRGWVRREGEVKNLDLVQRAYALAQARPRVRIQWIKAHDGSRWNEYADALSTAHLRSEV